MTQWERSWTVNPLNSVVAERSNSAELVVNLLREKCLSTEVFLVRIFPHSDWIRRDTVFLRIQSDCEKIRTKKNIFNAVANTRSDGTNVAGVVRSSIKDTPIRDLLTVNILFKLLKSKCKLSLKSFRGNLRDQLYWRQPNELLWSKLCSLKCWISKCKVIFCWLNV